MGLSALLASTSACHSHASQRHAGQWQNGDNRNGPTAAQAQSYLRPIVLRLLGPLECIAGSIDAGHSLADQYFNLAQLGDNLFGLVSLDSLNLILRLVTIPVDQLGGGGSICAPVERTKLYN